MFRCQGCGSQQLKGVKAQKVVLEKRQVIYFNAEQVKVGEGWEIVREVSVCKACSLR